MSLFLGVDTSNYTTSAALADGDGGIVESLKLPLPVKEGERGLRQSDAVFAHTVNLPELFERLGPLDVGAVGCSAFPRDADGSYMPCFLAGLGAARTLAAAIGRPLYRFSHQAGHIAAAVYSSGREELWEGGFLAFHVSGGTTELLRVGGGKIEKLGGTLDLNAGQAVDRVGVRLGLRFPCGPELERLALGFLAAEPERARKITPRSCVNGLDCNLSGLENKAGELISSGASPGEVAFYVLEAVLRTLSALTENALARCPGYPVLYAGGVMSNSIIRRGLEERFRPYFAAPGFSSDNAAGTALLCRRRAGGMPVWTTKK